MADVLDVIDHLPDAARLPKCVSGWQPMRRGQLFENGDQWLLAVPINDRHSARKWYYELSVVTICCDEDYFSCEVNDEAWGWDFFDADFGVKLR